MSKHTFFLAAFLFIALVTACNNNSSDENGESVFLAGNTMCGTVQFTDGCGEKTDTLIQFGLALVHHMTYEDAEHVFEKVIRLDKDCFWGHWGKALTFIHPLWPDEPNEERLNMGWSLVNKAMDLASTDRERYFGKALAAYYKDGLARSEPDRLKTYEAGWKAAHAALDDDLEAELFHALCRLSTVAPEDKSYTVQREVGATAEAALEVIPDHPGGFHYAIHAYDFPPLAANALRVARNYGKIAPEIPHALHMPTHIFTRLGYWDESLEWNLKSAEAAIAMPFNGMVSLHYFHALDYIVYAYLQKGDNARVRELLAGVDTLEGPFQPHAGSAYMLGAVPARYALERHAWEEAVQIPVRTPDHYPWERFPAFEALTYFGKGMGAARTGNTKLAQECIAVLDSFQNQLAASRSTAYWATQVEIQKLAVDAWNKFSNGQKDAGVEVMRRSAELERGTEKSPITPGEILPANELLGDMLASMGENAEALEVYNIALERSPNRLNSLYGAAKSAEALGDTEKARSYFASIVQISGDTQSQRPEVEEAISKSGRAL